MLQKVPGSAAAASWLLLWPLWGKTDGYRHGSEDFEAELGPLEALRVPEPHCTLRRSGRRLCSQLSQSVGTFSLDLAGIPRVETKEQL